MKVLIVDDEIKLSKLIYKLIHWESLGLTFCDFCMDGLEALQKMEIHSPDIIITDIRMPNLDGLELITRIKEVNKDCYILIISGHNDFSYAKEAIKLGVNDYLLKPIKEDEINTALERIIERNEIRTTQKAEAEIMRKRIIAQDSALKERLIDRILFEEETRADKKLELEEINRTYGCHFLPGQFQVLLAWMHAAEEETWELQPDFLVNRLESSGIFENEKIREHVVCHADGAYVVLLNYEKEGDVDAEAIARKIRGITRENREILNIKDAFFFVSLPNDSLEEVHECREKQMKLLAHRFAMPPMGIVLEEKEDPFEGKERIDEIGAALISAVEVFDREQIDQIKEEVLTLLKESGEGRPGAIHYLCATVFDRLRAFLRSRQMEGEEALLASLHSIYTRSCDYRAMVEETTERLLEFLEESERTRKKERNKSVDRARNYIDLHYREPLSLELVGKEVGLNASYLSNVFKREFEISFVDYITKVRIEKSKDILIQSDRTIADIAEEVGYRNARYYSKAFRKLIGITPQEYRKLYAR